MEGETGALIAAYAYDPQGRRMRKTTPAETRYFHYTDEGLAGEYTAGGTPIRQYGYWPDSTWTTDPLYQKTAEGYAFYQNDHLGTPQRLLAPNGAAVWAGRYRAFGEVVEESGDWGNALRFPGQYHDRETGLDYNYFRNYAARVGRYSGPDPLGILGGPNAYMYANANPTVYLDPFGLTPLHPYNEHNWEHCVPIVKGRGTQEKEYSYITTISKVWFGVYFDNVGFAPAIDSGGKKHIGVEADYYNLYLYKRGLVEGTLYIPYVEMVFYCKEEGECGEPVRWQSGPHKFLDGKEWKEEDIVDKWHEIGKEPVGRFPLPLPFRIPL